MLYPSILIHLKKFNQAEGIVSDILYLLRCPTCEVMHSPFHWKVIDYVQDFRYANHVYYNAEAFDKLGYLFLSPSPGVIRIHFIPKSEKNPPHKMMVSLLMLRFVYFIKKHFREPIDYIEMEIK